jgi:hypothetical protein
MFGLKIFEFDVLEYVKNFDRIDFKRTFLFGVLMQCWAKTQGESWSWFAPYIQWITLYYLKWILIPAEFIATVDPHSSWMSWIQEAPWVAFKFVVRLGDFCVVLR